MLKKNIVGHARYRAARKCIERDRTQRTGTVSNQAHRHTKAQGGLERDQFNKIINTISISIVASRVDSALACENSLLAH